MKGILNHFTEDLAIDLGTANTLIYVKGKGIILDEPSVVAVHNGVYNMRNSFQRQVQAVGSEAKEMLGRTPENIRAMRPLKDGVIADFMLTEQMLKYFIRKVQPRKFFFRPRIIISVPCQSTEVERRAIRESAEKAGGRDVYLLEEPMAVAIGMNLPVGDPTGSMVVDIGGGTTEIAVISLGGLVHSDTVRIAGDLFNNEIQLHMQNKYNMLIGERSAEQVKHAIGTAWGKSKVLAMEIRGKDHQGNVRKHDLKSTEIFEVLNSQIERILQAVRRALEKSPPQLSADIWERGILLAGGGALLRDIDRRFTDELGIPALVAEEPLTCVARGCGKVLEQTNLLNRIRKISR